MAMRRRHRWVPSDAGSPCGPSALPAVVLCTAMVAWACYQFLAVSTSSIAWYRGDAVMAIPAFAAAQEAVNSSEHVELWRGRPRYGPSANDATYVERAFGAFESTPIPLNEEDARWLRAMCASPRKFGLHEEGLYSLCGGFHADWAVVFTSPERTAEFGLCFGCGEVQILAGGQDTLHLDLQDLFEWVPRLEPYLRK